MTEQTVLVLDWPNLLVGALIGVIVTAIPWRLDHAQSRRARFADTLSEWAVAAKRIELLALQKATTAAQLYGARVDYPIDRWRLILGPEDFLLLEAMEGAYFRRELAAQAVVDSPGDAVLKRHQRTIEVEWREASVAFINMSRGLQDDQHLEALYRESRRRFWRSLRHHPIRTVRTQHRERTARREATRPRKR